jgi:predicted protein tyrosine phosphatase
MKHQFIGIDIGKQKIHVSYPSDEHPKEWQVIVFSFKDDPNWSIDLLNMTADDAVIVFEPTGFHLSAPIHNLFKTYRPNASIYHATHSTVGAVRLAHVSKQKTDHMDARTLALMAWQIGNGGDVRGVRLYNPSLDDQVLTLRLMINAYYRAKKTATRLMNRLHAFAHHIHPNLDIAFNTWIKLAVQDIITPADITHYILDAEGKVDGRSFVWVKKLHTSLPVGLETHPALRDEIKRTTQQYHANDQEGVKLAETIEHLMSFEPFATVNQRLLTIPYSSTIRNASFIVASNGHILDMDKYEFKACLGMNPILSNSDSQDKSYLSKKGYAPAKQELYIWTQTLLKADAPPNPIRPYYERLVNTPKKHKPFTSARGKMTMLISSVARRPQGYTYNG